jgi:glycosyltransferase involved in cell wall biosynthesis
MRPVVDILIPTCDRPAALAVTLTSLAMQSWRSFRLVISDQSDGPYAEAAGEVQAALRLIRAHGQCVEVFRHKPRQGMAEQRQFLLDQAGADYVLYLDDDLILEPFVIEQMLTAIREEGCGFVGSAVTGLSYCGDFRPHEQEIEFWEGRVQPEEVLPGSMQWQRYKLHNAANLYHVQRRLGLNPARTRKYRVAWVGGCVMYATRCLRDVGGFSFWRDLPPGHSGEDVLAQLRVMRAYGGCGLIPSGVYHQELPTTVGDRRVNAPDVLRIDTYPGPGSRLYLTGPSEARIFARRQTGNGGD